MNNDELIIRDGCTFFYSAANADVEAEARAVGLVLAQRFAMPANNLTLVFRQG